MAEPLVKIRIKTPTGKVTLGGFGPEKYQMYKLGQFAVKTVKDRVANEIGSNDMPMPALRGGYRKWKAGTGKGGRNLRLTGAMLDNFTVRYADPKQVKMGITSRLGRIKASANERRAPWFGFSRGDEKRIFTEATRVLGPNLKGIGVRLRGVTGAARRPIWLEGGIGGGISALRAAA